MSRVHLTNSPIKPRENDLGSKIELLTLKAFVSDHALFCWSIGAHLSALVLAKPEPDESEHHQDGSGYP